MMKPRLFLERKEDDLQQLLSQFSSTSLMDERSEMLSQLMELLWSSLEQETMLAAANQEQIEQARLAVERSVFSQVWRAHGG